jgi:hypothetical protein
MTRRIWSLVAGIVVGFGFGLSAIVAAVLAVASLGLKAYLYHLGGPNRILEVSPRELGFWALRAAAVALAFLSVGVALWRHGPRTRRPRSG